MIELPRYIDCPDCKGCGQQMYPRAVPDGYIESWEDCDFCEGEGRFEEADFIILRLEGRV